MSHPEIIAEFTEDVLEGRRCDKAGCNVTLRAGEGHLIGSYRPGQPDRLVCDVHNAYYRNKPTSVRVGAPAGYSSALPDPQVIRASVSAAQSRASVNPPRVVAMTNHPASVSAVQSRASINPPATNHPATRTGPAAQIPSHLAALMPPPPLPRVVAHRQSCPQLSRGPEIHALSVWNRSSAYQQPSGPGVSTSFVPQGSVGYTDAHPHYRPQSQCWAKAASQQGPVTEVISLEITAVYESSIKRRHARNNPIKNICEGLKGVDAQSTAKQLVRLALKTISPLIKACDPQFPWREDEFIVRDKQWVDLAKYTNTKPYFYDECLHPGKGKNSRTLVFKSDRFGLFVVVPEKQWGEYEAFKEKCQQGMQVSLTSPLLVTPPRARRLHRNHSVLPSATTSSTSDLSAIIAAPISHQLVSAAARIPPEASTSTSTKRSHHRHSHSGSTVSSQSPPPKRAAKTNFASPDRNQLKEALKVGGGVDFNIKDASKYKVEPVDFYPIPTLALDQLVGEKAAFSIKTSDVSTGSIRVSLAIQDILGAGAFKSAHAAQLTLYSLRPTGIGSQPNQPIAAKRLYIGDTPKPPFMRPSLGEESKRLYREANVLYWAKALLKMTYDYVDRSIQEADEEPPFEIPRLRFVDAGLLFAYAAERGAAPLSGKGKAGTLSSVYLAEELISTDGFIKYIHNGDAAPRTFGDPAIDEIAEFLSFTQHCQYAKTGGQVYISDYQGCPPLLTDPQILTHPDVGDGMALFGDGNVEKGVALFQKQHICNKFCLWPGFGLQVFENSDDDDDDDGGN